jgi:SAM-dependent methyltransferase
MHLALSYGYADVFGVDVSEEMLLACRERNLIVEQADVWDYLARSPNARWQVVSAFDLLEHFPKEQGYRLLREIKRILAPQGICLLKLPNAGSPWGNSVTASDLTHEAAYTSFSLIQLARLAGFRECEIREVGPAPGSAASAVRGLLWRGLRQAYAGMNLIETGSVGSGIYSQVMMGRLAT